MCVSHLDERVSDDFPLLLGVCGAAEQAGGALPQHAVGSRLRDGGAAVQEVVPRVDHWWGKTRVGSAGQFIESRSNTQRNYRSTACVLVAALCVD